jgi:hypothetical protein
MAADKLHGGAQRALVELTGPLQLLAAVQGLAAVRGLAVLSNSGLALCPRNI